MTNSIQQQISLLESTKAGNRQAIMEKGVMVYASDLYSTYPTRISQISMTPGDKDGLLAALVDKSITSFVIPQGTEVIRPYAFAECNLLGSITIPDSVKIIREYAFFNQYQTNSHYSQLTEITIPASVTSIGDKAFYNIDTLTSLTFLSETPATLGQHALDTNNCPIYVPADSVDTYKSAWSNYASRIQETVPRFVKITSLSEATTGKYLVVDTSAQIAMNASLIKNTTTAQNGLNDNTNSVNTIDVTITDDVIELNETTLNAAAYYDATNQCLSWTDPDTQQLYYIQWKTGTTFVYGSERFAKNEYNVSPKTVNGNFTFWSGSGVRSMGKNNLYKLIRFYSENNSAYYTNIALFKLT